MTGWLAKPIGLLLAASSVVLTQTLPYDTTYRSTYYEQKRTLYESLPNTRGEIIFLGNITLDTLDYAWDTEHGGLFYFMDAHGHPPQQLEWDQKLWWVHVETLISLLKGFQKTGNPACWQWFERVHAYTWQHFPDSENGEWFGYLNRRGEVLLPLKGGKWKGCFHVPRGLYQCGQVLNAL